MSADAALRTSARTVWPSATSLRIRARPMKPEPPVMNACDMGASLSCKPLPAPRWAGGHVMCSDDGLSALPSKPFMSRRGTIGFLDCSPRGGAGGRARRTGDVGHLGRRRASCGAGGGNQVPQIGEGTPRRGRHVGTTATMARLTATTMPGLLQRQPRAIQRSEVTRYRTRQEQARGGVGRGGRASSSPPACGPGTGWSPSLARGHGAFVELRLYAAGDPHAATTQPRDEPRDERIVFGGRHRHQLSGPPR